MIWTGIRSWWAENERWYIAVGLANLMVATSSILVPLMVSRTLHQSVGAVGLISGAVSFVGVVGSLTWGRLSDVARRRKPFIVWSYAASGVCLMLISLVGSFAQLLALNMVLQFFWVANASVTVLLVIEKRDETSWERKIGHLNQFGAMGWVGGFALGTAWMGLMLAWMGEQNAIRSLFALIGVGSLTAAILAARHVPRVVVRGTRRPFRGAILELGNFLVSRSRVPFHLYHYLQPKRVLGALLLPGGFRKGTKRFLLSTLLAFTGMGFFGIPLPVLLAERFGFSSSSVFLFYMVQHAAIVAAYPLASRRIKRLGNRSVQLGAVGVRLLLFSAAAAYLALAGVVPRTWILALVFSVYGMTWSYFQLSGVALISRLAKPENRGMALGLYNALAGAGWILAGFGGGLVAQGYGYAAAFGVSAGLLLATIGVLLTVPAPKGTPAAAAPIRPKPLTGPAAEGVESAAP